MPSERGIDNYINEIEEKNQIYMEEELEYAKKCHNLEEQLGCSLEVVFKALINGVYHKYGKSLFSICKFQKLEVRLEYKYGKYFLVPIHKADFSLSLEEYQKTWWLSKTKKE